MPKYDETEILSLVDREESECYGFGNTSLEEDRSNALKYYLGEPYGNEVTDRSQVVTREVMDTVEWVLPALLKIFMSGDKVVKFNPRGQDDVDQAETETEYINFVITEKNEGFQVFYTWFKDALISKTGYVKSFWEVTEDLVDETYEGLTEDELAFLMQDKDVEIVSQSSEDYGYGPIYSVKLRQTVKSKQVRIMNVPPEELLVSTRTRSVTLEDSPFVEHRTFLTVSDIRDMGYDLDMTRLGTKSYETFNEDRNIYGESDESESDLNEENKRVLVRDCYLRLDMDGDGIAELRRVLIAGSQVLENEDCDFIPFAPLCPIPMPHRHVGLSYADIVMDIQLIKSTITRQLLDNMYLSNNVRYGIDINRVNLDDMLVSRPGGVVRTNGDPAGAVVPMVSPQLGGTAFQMLEYLDTLREGRTGVSRTAQGIDVNTLANNQTATGVNALMSAAQQRVELVARVFAETGVKTLFRQVHALVCKHSDNQEEARLNNKYVPIDPRTWKKRTDMSIAVGLGTGNKDQQMVHLTQILAAQKEALVIGLATPKNIYNALAKLTINAGFKNPEEFWTNPEQAQQQPKPPNPEMVKAQSQMQLKQVEIQAEQQKFQAETQIEQESKAKDRQTEMMKIEMENQTKEKIAIIQSQTELEVQRIQAEAAQQSKLLELAAGVMAAQAGSQAGGQGQAHNLVNGTQLDQNAQAQGMTPELLAEMMQSIHSMASTMSAPKQIIHDQNGRPIGIAPVMNQQE